MILNDELLEIELEQILVNPFQPRREFDKEQLLELANSISEIGLIHPPAVRQTNDGKYELISGERRFRAAQLAGLKKIPVILKKGTDAFSAQAALVENVQRVDLNPLEVAKALRKLMQQFGLNQETLAEKIGKKRSTVANYLRLLGLPKQIQAGISIGSLTMGHAKVILSLPNEEQQVYLYDRIKQEELTVRQTETIANKMLNKEGKTPLKYETRNFYLEELSERLQRKLGTKVHIQSMGKKGRISINYYNLDDLDRLLALLGVQEG